jgi:serine/threonine protein kinase
MATERPVLVDRLQDARFHENGVYLSDFGLPYFTRLPIQGQPAFVPGTRAYLAPEVIENGEDSITTKSDMWALGCIGYELCIGKKLAGNRELLKRHIYEGRKNPQPLEDLITSIPSRFGTEVREIIRACLTWDPQRRCTAVELRTYLLRLPRA